MGSEMCIRDRLVGASQPSGAAAFDTTLVPKSIFFTGKGTSGDAMTRTSTTPDNRNRWLFGTWYHPLRVPNSSGTRMTILLSHHPIHPPVEFILNMPRIPSVYFTEMKTELRAL